MLIFQGIKVTGVAEGKWGQTVQVAGFVGVSTHFFSHLKTRF